MRNSLIIFAMFILLLDKGFGQCKVWQSDKSNNITTQSLILLSGLYSCSDNGKIRNELILTLNNNDSINYIFFTYEGINKIIINKDTSMITIITDSSICVSNRKVFYLHANQYFTNQVTNNGVPVEHPIFITIHPHKRINLAYIFYSELTQKMTINQLQILYFDIVFVAQRKETTLTIDKVKKLGYPGLLKYKKNEIDYSSIIHFKERFKK